MGIDDSDIARLLAGSVPNDDAQLGQVSAFLGDLKAAYPPSSIAAIEDHHLAVVAREVRAVGASRVQERDAQRSRKGIRRTVAAVGAGLVAVLTVGVGVASAMGLDPLELIPGLVTNPSATPNAPARTPDPSGNGQQASSGSVTPSAPSTQPPSADPSVPPTTAGQPSASASATHGTAGNCGNGKGAGSATCVNGKAGKENTGNGTSNGKSGKGNSGSSSSSSSASSTKDKATSGNGNSTKTAPSPTPTTANDTGNGKAKGGSGSSRATGGTSDTEADATTQS